MTNGIQNGYQMDRPTLGILQGRLSPSTNGQLQCFPSLNWADEFTNASELRLNCIELLWEPLFNPLNPLNSESGIEKLKSVSNQTGISIQSICVDYFMQRPFWNSNKNEEAEAWAGLEWISKVAQKIGAKILVLPFFEKAEIKNEDDLKWAIPTLKKASDHVAPFGISLALELTEDATVLDRVLKSIHSDNVGICMDTGNTTGKGLDPARDMEMLGSGVIHMHLKDRRKSDYKNVILGKGDTDFKRVFQAVKKTKYKGMMILETDRGDDAVLTARAHKEFIETLVGPNG